MHDPSIKAYFMVADLTDAQAADFNFGSEGARYKFMKVEHFMADDSVIPELKLRLASYLATLTNK